MSDCYETSKGEYVCLDCSGLTQDAPNDDINYPHTFEAEREEKDREDLEAHEQL